MICLGELSIDVPKSAFLNYILNEAMTYLCYLDGYDLIDKPLVDNHNDYMYRYYEEEIKPYIDKLWSKIEFGNTLDSTALMVALAGNNCMF
jgi:hypothetical protein